MREPFLKMASDGDLTPSDIATLIYHRHLASAMARSLPSLSAEVLQQHAPNARLRTYSDSEVIVQEGDLAEAFYILVSGQARVARAGLEGAEEQDLATLSAGEFFGETGILRRQPREASVYARGETEVIELPRSDFESIIVGDDRTRSDVANVVCERLFGALVAEHGRGAA